MDAREAGYSYIGISGGEPLLWSDLIPFLRFARNQGFSTSLTTNGTLLDDRIASLLASVIDLVAVSVDGPPADHAALRGSSKAFGAMCAGLSTLRKADIAFSVAFTLTRFNAGRVKWLYEFASQQGAMAIHVHPLCCFGAAKAMSNAVPDSQELKAAAWLLALMAENGRTSGPVITLDAIRMRVLRNTCWPMLAEGGDLGTARFCDLVPALVVESDGCIVPFIYGFPRCWKVGFIDDGLPEPEIENWRVKTAGRVSELIRSTVSKVRVADRDFVDVFALILAAAHEASFAAVP